MWTPAKFGPDSKCDELVIPVQIFSCGIQQIGETNIVAIVGTPSIVDNPPKESVDVDAAVVPGLLADGIIGRLGPDHLKRRMG